MQNEIFHGCRRRLGDSLRSRLWYFTLRDWHSHERAPICLRSRAFVGDLSKPVGEWKIRLKSCSVNLPLDSLLMKPDWLDASCSLMDAVVCFCLDNVLFNFNIRGVKLSSLPMSVVVQNSTGQKPKKENVLFHDLSHNLPRRMFYFLWVGWKEDYFVHKITTVVKCHVSNSAANSKICHILSIALKTTDMFSFLSTLYSLAVYVILDDNSAGELGLMCRP